MVCLFRDCWGKKSIHFYSSSAVCVFVWGFFFNLSCMSSFGQLLINLAAAAFLNTHHVCFVFLSCMKMYFLSNYFSPPVLTAFPTGLLYKVMHLELHGCKHLLGCVYLWAGLLLFLVPVALASNDALESLQPLWWNKEQTRILVRFGLLIPGKTLLSQEISACDALAPGMILKILDSELVWT